MQDMMGMIFSQTEISIISPLQLNAADERKL
jgi:hypothetical protein